MQRDLRRVVRAGARAGLCAMQMGLLLMKNLQTSCGHKHLCQRLKLMHESVRTEVRLRL